MASTEKFQSKSSFRRIKQFANDATNESWDGSRERRDSGSKLDDAPTPVVPNKLPFRLMITPDPGARP